MPKYYVNAGEFKYIISRPTPKDAAIDAFRELENNPVSQLNYITVVSEHGFNDEEVQPDDYWFLTLEILEQSDQVENYNPNNCEE